MPRLKQSITCHAIQLRQNASRPVYVFSLPAQILCQVSTVSRLARDDQGNLIGYQRPAVRRHIRDIADYLNQKEVLFPNNIILAFSSDVVFKPDGRYKANSQTVVGRLKIPLPRQNETKPGWIVDGQQRVLALVQANRPDLPIPVSAFITDDICVQRDQFIRVNNTKPLPRGLVNELLPTLSSELPDNLERHRLPSLLCDHLNQHPSSPFCGLIRRASTPKAHRKQAVVKDTSLLLAIENSLSSPSGCLFPYHNLATGNYDLEGMTHLLVVYWSAVRDTFPDAWGKPAHQSRLMHGVGIRALGNLMDRVMGSVAPFASEVAVHVKAQLRPLASVCRWTAGVWDELGGLAWNDLQNTPQHVRLLSGWLQARYEEALRMS